MSRVRLRRSRINTFAKHSFPSDPPNTTALPSLMRFIVWYPLTPGLVPAISSLLQLSLSHLAHSRTYTSLSALLPLPPPKTTSHLFLSYQTAVCARLFEGISPKTGGLLHVSVVRLSKYVSLKYSGPSPPPKTRRCPCSVVGLVLPERKGGMYVHEWARSAGG